MKKSLLLSAACLFLCGLAQESQASGFGLKLTSGKVAARANAGSAVESDVLASFNNPANLIQIMGYHAGVMGTQIIPHVKFRGRSTNPLNINQTNDATVDRQIGKGALVPAMAVGARLHERLSFGIWVGAPWGLKMNYGSEFGGNRYVIKSGLTTININPSVAVKLHDMVSIGAGFQAQRSKVKLTARASSAVGLAQALLINNRTKQEVKGDDWAYGWTAGILLQPLKPVKLGFSYRSQLNTNLKGHLRFTKVPLLLANNPALQNSSAKAKLKYPHIFTLSGSWDVTNRFTVLFDVIRTNWSSINKIIIRTPSDSRKGVIVQKWKDSWFYSGGFNFKANECWTIHGGIGYDETPTKNKYRVPGIPDNDKWWFALGTSVEITKKIDMTVGLGYEKFKNAKIRLRQANEGNGAPSAKGNLTGRIKEQVTLVTVGFNVKL